MFEEEKDTIDMAEIWRQNYMDAKDEIRELKFRIAELESENEFLKKDKDKTKNHIYHYNENSVIDFLG